MIALYIGVTSHTTLSDQMSLSLPEEAFLLVSLFWKQHYMPGKWFCINNTFSATEKEGNFPSLCQ